VPLQPNFWIYLLISITEADPVLSILCNSEWIFTKLYYLLLLGKHTFLAVLLGVFYPVYVFVGINCAFPAAHEITFMTQEDPWTLLQFELIKRLVAVVAEWRLLLVVEIFVIVTEDIALSVPVVTSHVEVYQFLELFHILKGLLDHFDVVLLLLLKF
jgi:hypothetical protein